MKTTLYLGLLFTLIFTANSCNKIEADVTPTTITASRDSVEFVIEGGKDSITISTNKNDWQVKSTNDWVVPALNSISSGPSKLVLTVAPNAEKKQRTAFIRLTRNNGTDSLRIKIIQITRSINGTNFPDYSNPIPADASGMSNTATGIAKQMYLGWNLGNTLEVPGNELAWGNAKTTQLLIDSIKAAGINTVRLPCAWDSYILDPTTWQIKPYWLARVKEVVDYCYKNNMFVMINIHWDGGWLENNCTVAKQSVNNSKQRALWEQIAAYFRNYDEHLLFASANEPNASDATQMAVLMSYHQTFVNAVRSTGGKNAYRTLIIQGPNTDIDKTNTLMNSMPTDKVPNRLIAEVHYYTPWQFCGLDADASWGKMFYYWGTGFHSSTDPTRNATWGEESDMRALFQKMKTKFVDKGIPVVLGEYGATRRLNLTGDALTLHLASRAYFIKYVTQQAKNYGLVPVVWDNGVTGNTGMGFFNRANGVAVDRQALKAFQEGAALGNYPY